MDKDWKNNEVADLEDGNEEILVWEVTTPNQDEPDDALVGTHVFRSYKDALNHVKDLVEADFIHHRDEEAANEELEIVIRLIKMPFGEFITVEGN